MATQYQTAFTTAKSAGSAAAIDRQFKLTERQVCEARNVGVTSPTSFQSQHATYVGESGNQKQVDLLAEERQLAESRN